jgi:hypothetical protein
MLDGIFYMLLGRIIVNPIALVYIVCYIDQILATCGEEDNKIVLSKADNGAVLSTFEVCDNVWLFQFLFDIY